MLNQSTIRHKSLTWTEEAEYGQPNLAHVTENEENKKKKLKQTPVPTKSEPRPRSVKALQTEAERLRRNRFVKEMSFKFGVI